MANDQYNASVKDGIQVLLKPVTDQLTGWLSLISKSTHHD